MTKKEFIEIAEYYETKYFIKTDPIQFLYRYRDHKDIEVVAVITQWLSYGRRNHIIPAIERTLDDTMKGYTPFEYIMSDAYCDFENNYYSMYRLNSWHHFYHLCKKIKEVYIKFDTLEDAVIDIKKKYSYKYYHQAVCHLLYCENLIPKPTSLSACKKINMMLRWLVRQDSCVDIGLWQNISPRRLLVPLDTHVVQSSVKLGIIKTRCENLNNAIKITDWGKTIFNKDPSKIDFVLFGLSENKDNDYE